MAPFNQMNNPPPLHTNLNSLRRQRRPMPKESSGNSFDVAYKVLLLGDTMVGKTSLQRSIAGRDFRPDIGSSIGIDFANKIIPIEGAKVNLQIWDTAGQKNFRTIGRNYYSSTKAFVLVYDVTNEETFRLTEQFSQYIEHARLDIERRYLVANKIDLLENRIVDEETGRRFAVRNSMTYFETSCKTGENVSDLFEQIASDLVRQHDPNKLQCHQPKRNDFAYIYEATPSNNAEENNNNERVREKPRSNTPLTSRNEGFNIRRLLFCCNPKETTATLH